MGNAKRTATVLHACGIAIALLVAGVGCSGKRPSSDAGMHRPRQRFQPYLICDLIKLALDRCEDGTSFVELVDSPAGRTGRRNTCDRRARRGEAGEPRPVLVLPSEAIGGEFRQQASRSPPDGFDPGRRRKLDQFVADGGCG